MVFVVYVQDVVICRESGEVEGCLLDSEERGQVDCRGMEFLAPRGFCSVAVVSAAAATACPSAATAVAGV